MTQHGRRLASLLASAAATIVMLGLPRQAAAQIPVDAVPNDAEITVPAPTAATAQWWVDADIAGNTATSIGSIERCRQFVNPDLVQVDVVAFNVSGMSAFKFLLHFDPAYLQFISADVNFLLATGGPIAFQSVIPSDGTVLIGAGLLPPPLESPVSGSGVLARLTFHAKAPFGQSGFVVDPGFAHLLTFFGTEIPSDPTPAKASGVIDPTATVGCWTVNSQDDAPNLSPGDGIANASPVLGIVETTLRAAIQEANAFNTANGMANAHRISFRIPNAGLACGVPCMIAPLAALPPINDPVNHMVVDGLTQAGIVLNGGAAVGGPDGFDVNTNNNTIKGLTINGFAGGAGVHIAAGSTGNMVVANRIGTNVTADGSVPNARGVIVDGAGNLIGGVNPADGNVISGNTGSGVVLRNGAAGNVVRSNLIGTNGANAPGLGNGTDGILIDGAPNNTVGGLTAVPGAPPGNVISGNGNNGVRIVGAAAVGNIVEGSVIGLDAPAIATLPNGGGVLIGGAPNNTVGGPAAGARNIISGNGADGVVLNGAGAAGNLVRNNIIGTNAASAAGLGNGFDGVVISDAPGNTVGGGAGLGNTISGNGIRGLHIIGGSATGNVVEGNCIGTDVPCGSALANGTDGVLVEDAPGNQIGASTPGNPGTPPGNVISGNGTNGVRIVGAGATGNQVQGNCIGLGAGLNAGCIVAVPNALDGVAVVGAPSTTIGGATASEGNIISKNGTPALGGIPAMGNGITISGTAATATDIRSNIIGLNAALARVGNTVHGILITNAPNTTIGGLASPGTAPGNFIGDNGGDGIQIAGGSATNTLVRGNEIDLNTGTGIFINLAPANTIGQAAAGAANLITRNGLDGMKITGDNNTVQGNFIGTTSAGGLTSGNGDNGIMVASASNTLIGGVGAGNIISGNTADGVLITGSGTAGTQVQGNNIGTNPAGTAAVPNGNNGLTISGSAVSSQIGGSLAGAGNLISGNTVDQVVIDGSGSDSNRVQGNVIGPNVSRTASLAPAGSQAGIRIRTGPRSTVIKGNTVDGNTTEGIVVEGADANQILENLVGSASLPNGSDGILVGSSSLAPPLPPTPLGSSENLVSLNSIGNNGGDGIHIAGISGGSSDRNLLTGNSSIGNKGNGVTIEGVADGNIVGGSLPEARNVISGNFGAGVALVSNGGGAPSHSTVAGNYIGVESSGTIGSPNGTPATPQPGVLVAGTNTTVGPGNVISANTAAGVDVTGSGTTGTLVLGNFIGTDPGGAIALANAAAGVRVDGAPGTTIGGTAVGDRNVISANGTNGIEVLAAAGSLIQGNFIGTQGSGSAALGNAAAGIRIQDAASTIGGSATGAGNVIAGNLGNGIEILGTALTGSLVQGNFIGTSVAGSGLGNAGDGVHLEMAGNTVGGTTAGAGNVISSNGGDGIGISAAGNVVQGNRIGSSPSGGPLGNTGSGVRIAGSGTMVGGTASGAANIIDFNLATGVLVQSGTGNSILSNSISGNGSLGISLSGGSVTPNHPGCAVPGPNNFQNYPVLLSAITGSITITGTLNCTPGTTYRLEFFSNAACDPSGFGQGEGLIGSTNVTTDSAGNAAFTVTFPATVAAGQVITATATSPTGDTSEFSACRTVVEQPQKVLAGVILQLDTLVTAGVLNSGQGNALEVKLQAAIRSLDRNDVHSTCGQLEAFLNQVKAFVSAGILSNAQAGQLVDKVQGVRSQLNC